MGRASLSVKGTADLIGKLKRNANLDDVKHTVMMNGAEMHANMMRDSPVDTGFLKRSIKIKSLDNGFTVRVTPTADYAPYLIYGTRFMYARDFFRPNYYEQRKKFLSDLNRLMK
ncbi:HK97 gp10 family phage protein [Bacillus sp. IITD106]|nr:HK97 gp10 family phage protein [Bacillus sp. IITD106]